MDQAQLHAIEARCTQESMPHCQVNCPLRMDIRAFMGHMVKGNLREARKVLERHLPLPEIMARICDHPCENKCLRKELGGALQVGGLESVCIAAVPKQTTQFPRPPKAKRVGVIGSTLAGLVVAFELSRKAWPVTIFYEADVVDAMLQRFSKLSAEVVQNEIVALEKNNCVFTKQKLTSEFFAKVCKDYDAVFIDGDAAPDIYASIDTVQKDSLLAGENICAAGFVAGMRSSSEQAGDARRAATTIERMITGVSLLAGRENELVRTSNLYTPLQGIESKNLVLPKAETFTLEEAGLEAGRCLQCECMVCVKECVFLQKYGSYPRSYARQIYNNASIVKGEHLANKLINSCTLCGQCTALCPEAFPMPELCLQSRQDMVQRGYMPPSAHEFALEDMQSANEHAVFMGDPAKDIQKCGYLFFPGCQLAASRGEQVLDVYESLRVILKNEHGVGLGLGCCGIPAHWAGELEIFKVTLEEFRGKWQALGRPRCILACSSCMQVFSEYLPDVPVQSLWEVLDEHSVVKSPTISGKYIVHDPCTARKNDTWQKAVRSLAVKCGIQIEEPLHTGTTTACCGYGGGVWNAQPELADHMARHRGEELAGTALASCIMCRDRLVNNGSGCVHLFDILPLPKATPQDALEPAPGLSGRRLNRANLQRLVLHTYMGHDMERTSYRVHISAELLKVLEKRHILRDDVEQAVLAVEDSKKRFLEKSSGHYIGSWMPRNVTFWVRYSIQDESYNLHDAWCHRMVVPNTGGKEEHTSPSLRIRA